LFAMLLDVSQQRLRSIWRCWGSSEWPGMPAHDPSFDSKARLFAREFRSGIYLTLFYVRTRIQHGATME
jgi:hypothetical protein